MHLLYVLSVIEYTHYHICTWVGKDIVPCISLWECRYVAYYMYTYIHIYIYIYIILIARVRVQYGKIFYEHAKYFHEPKASENVA